MKRYKPELGQMAFGNPVGEVDFDSLEDSSTMEYGLRYLAGLTTRDTCYASGGFENDVFEIRPYYWGEEDDEAEKPNFRHKMSGFEIRWYKYIGRGMSTNRTITPQEFSIIFKECLASLEGA